MKTELSKIAQDLEQGTITENEAQTLLLGLLGVSGSACSKCGMSDFDMKFKPVQAKIYWSEHNEIENIASFTRNDRYYSYDRIEKECLVHTCKTCGYKKAVGCS
jgi:predicted nucleic-acid-binding Zn-ribbon protein